jgi:hypothetical protein
MMEMTEGDLLDKFCIVGMKVRSGMDECKDEYAALGSWACNISQVDGVARLYEDLEYANARIWNLETDIRSGKMDASKLSDGRPTKDAVLRMIGKTALEIRDWNAKRVAAKNAINALFNRPPEVKVNHASEARA